MRILFGQVFVVAESDVGFGVLPYADEGEQLASLSDFARQDGDGYETHFLVEVEGNAPYEHVKSITVSCDPGPIQAV